MRQRILLPCLLLAAALATTGTAFAQMGGKGKKGALPEERAAAQEEARRDFQPSGLTPMFPAGANCPEVASPFGSSTRYDGSFRPMTRYGGRHGGMDLTLAEGTPLRALGKGRIVHLGAGGQAEGFFLWLQLAPADTGLPFWVYAKYQHFQELPKRRVGEIVQAGDILGPSGKSGTTGGHYGTNGYPHLHLTTVASPSGEFEIDGSRVAAQSPRLFDPVALFVTGLADVAEVQNLPEARKTVAIPYMTGDGAIHPAGSKLVWPVQCAGSARENRP
ncbi:MAG: M23 family metallopeptidase [Thermodesulfobacteriota bacterium]